MRPAKHPSLWIGLVVCGVVAVLMLGNARAIGPQTRHSYPPRFVDALAEVTGQMWDIERPPGGLSLWAWKIDPGSRLDPPGIEELAVTLPGFGFGWFLHRAPVRDPRAPFRDFDMVSDTEGWAVSTVGWSNSSVPDETHVLRWNGSQWTTAKIIRLGAGLLYSISASGPDNVWVVGSRPFSTNDVAWVWHYDGASWTRMRLPTGDGVYLSAGILTLGPHDTWVGGTILLHWNGTRWVRPDLSGLPYSGVVGLAASSSTDVWASTEVLRGDYLLHWNGIDWEAIRSPSNWGLDLSQDGTPWLIDDIFHLVYLNGDSWTTIKVEPGDCDDYTLANIDAVARDDVYAAGACGGHPLVLHYDGDVWTRL